MKAITLSPQDYVAFTSDKLIKVLRVIEYSAKRLVTVIFDRLKPRTQKLNEFKISLEVHQSFEMKLPRGCHTESMADELAKKVVESAGYETPDGLDGGDIESHVYEVFQRNGRWTALVSVMYSTMTCHECGTLKQAKVHGNRIAKEVKLTVQPDFGSDAVNYDCKIKALKCLRNVTVG